MFDKKQILQFKKQFPKQAKLSVPRKFLYGCDLRNLLIFFWSSTPKIIFNTILFRINYFVISRNSKGQNMDCSGFLWQYILFVSSSFCVCNLIYLNGRNTCNAAWHNISWFSQKHLRLFYLICLLWSIRILSMITLKMALSNKHI